MGLFINNGGNWVEMTAEKPIYTKVSSVWRTAFKMFYKDGTVWKQVYVGDTTPPSGDVTSVSGWKSTQTVNYSAATDDYTGVALYKLQVSVDDGAWTDVTDLTLTGGTYNYDSSGDPLNAKLEFRTKKTDGAGNTGYGTVTTQYRDDTGPTIQMAPTLSANATTLTITYRGATDGRSGMNTYYAQIQEYPSGTWATIKTGLTISPTTTDRTTTWTISSTYYKKNVRVRLVAKDNANNYSYAYSSAFQFDNVAPTAGSVTVYGNTSLGAIYGPTTDNGSTVHTSGVTSYRIEKKVNNGSWTDLASISTNGSTYTYNVPSSDYNKIIYFRTKATDRHGNVAYGTSGYRYVDTIGPTFNGDWSISANGNNMNFSYPSISDASSISSYKLQRLDTSTYVDVVTGLSTSGGSGTYTVPDSIRGAIKSYRLLAIDDRGNATSSGSKDFQHRPKGTFDVFSASSNTWETAGTPSWRGDIVSSNWSGNTMIGGYFSSTWNFQYGFWFYGANAFTQHTKGYAPDSAQIYYSRNSSSGGDDIPSFATHSHATQPGTPNLSTNNSFTGPVALWGGDAWADVSSGALSAMATNNNLGFFFYGPNTSIYNVYDARSSSVYSGLVSITFD